MKGFHRAVHLCAAIAASMLLASCIGIDVSAKIEANGSGTLSVEYRIAEEFASFGAQESDPGLPLPLSKNEIVRSLQHQKGLSLSSYEMKKNNKETIISFKIAFDSPDHLALYLDSEGKLARYSKTDGISRFVLSTGNAIPPMDAETKAAIQEKLQPYRFRLSLETSSGAPEVKIITGDYFSHTATGRTTAIEASMANVLLSDKPAEFEFAWK